MVAEEALATLTRLRSSVDQNDVAKQIAALTPKMGTTGEGWSNARHDAWIARRRMANIGSVSLACNKLNCPGVAGSGR